MQGLGDAVEYLLPYAEHRFCVRHLHANFKAKGYKGKAFKDELWAAARASNPTVFDKHMTTIKSMDAGAYTYLSGINPASWSRHAFGTHSKSDMLVNNLAESFNAWIKDARDKPLLTMMEMIRRQLMARLQRKRDGIRASTYKICPKIMKKLERSKDDNRNCLSRWQNELEFEVDHMYDARRIVNLVERTCTCGRWQLNGIPCGHACCAIYLHRQRPDDYLDGYYMVDKYMNAYESQIRAMPGPEEWPRVADCDEMLPPTVRVQPGRPKKVRRRAPDEPTNPYKISRAGYVVKCGNCGGNGHNYKGCHLPANPNRKIWNPKRKLGTKTSTKVSIV